LIGAEIRAAPRVYVMDDMAKATGDEALAHSASVYSNGMIELHAAGNEVVAFQLVFQADRVERGLDLRASDLRGPATLAADDVFEFFLAHYLSTTDGSYGWFPPGTAGVLPWEGKLWPDPLIPFKDPWTTPAAAVAAPFAIDPARQRNQAVWVDVFIPKGTPAGWYEGQIDCLREGRPFQEIPIRIEVFPFDLPDESHADAWGELYRETGVMFDSGVKFKEHPEADWPIYRRYQQLAHAHRLLATQRQGMGPVPRTPAGRPADRPDDQWGEDWSLFTPYVAPVLDGTLFTESAGYRGPRAGAGPTFFPAPFVETFYGADSLRAHLEKHKGRIDPELLETWTRNAAAFWREVQRQGWEDRRFFAYLLDEVDSARDGEGGAKIPMDEITRFHAAMRSIQAALDAGTGGRRRIHLLWTSHADATRWLGTPADLTPFISWWAPNGHALQTDFFPRAAATPGHTVWFYHSGHPAVGNHGINQLGIDLRLWGLLCARYAIDGFFVWSLMSFPERWDAEGFIPYNHPGYREGENRWGNGTLLYPGSRLTAVGAARAIEGPIPSYRLKALRRGLQDAEYAWLARRAGRGEATDGLLRGLIPAAFSEAPRPRWWRPRPHGLWSRRPEDYAAARLQLARLIQEGADPAD